MKLDPYFRKFNSTNKMTFGITYATSEKYILTLSHDEVVPPEVFHDQQDAGLKW